MDAARQQMVDDIIHDAHNRRDRIVAADVAREVVDELRNLEAAGHAWVADFIDTLLIRGAAKLCSDWRRRYSHTGKTRKGTEVAIPLYGAVIEADEDGNPQHVQLALFSMTLDQVRARRDSLAKQRDTLSAEVRWFSDLADVMEADRTLVTVADALARLEAA